MLGHGEVASHLCVRFRLEVALVIGVLYLIRYLRFFSFFYFLIVMSVTLGFRMTHCLLSFFTLPLYHTILDNVALLLLLLCLLCMPWTTLCLLRGCLITACNYHLNTDSYIIQSLYFRRVIPKNGDCAEA